MTAMFMFNIVGLRDFGKQYGLRIRWWNYVTLVLGSIPYCPGALGGRRPRGVAGAARPPGLGTDPACGRPPRTRVSPPSKAAPHDHCGRLRPCRAHATRRPIELPTKRSVRAAPRRIGKPQQYRTSYANGRRPTRP